MEKRKSPLNFFFSASEDACCSQGKGVFFFLFLLVVGSVVVPTATMRIPFFLFSFVLSLERESLPFSFNSSHRARESGP